MKSHLYKLYHYSVVSGRSAVWLAYLVWDQGAVGSNPTAPTIFSSNLCWNVIIPRYYYMVGESLVMPAKVIILFLAFTIPAIYLIVTSGPNSTDGKAIYIRHCKTCHRVMDDKKGMGPGLKTVITRRGEEWVRRFLTEPLAVWNSQDPTDISHISDILNNRLYKKKAKAPLPNMHKIVLKVNRMSGDRWVDNIVAFLRNCSDGGAGIKKAGKIELFKK